jgi:hypothetical protein
MTATRKELVLAGLMLCLIPLIAEGVLRLAGLQFEPVLYVADRQLGWKLHAGANGVFQGETRQYVRISSNGFHDRDRAYKKPENVVRIAVLGNSWTEALQLPLEQSYPALLEGYLNQRNCFRGKRVEVLNFGVAGYSTAQELLLLHNEVWKYDPDIVLVAFYSARDVANNVRGLNNAANPEQSPYFVYRDGRLTLDNTYQSISALQPRQMKLSQLKVEIENHLKVLQAINAMVRYVKTETAKEMVRGIKKHAAGDSTEDAVYKQPSTGDMEEAWRVSEGLLLAIRQETQSHGAELRVVTLANRPQVIPDPVKRAAFMSELGVADLSYADARVAALGQRAGFPVLVLAPTLSNYATKNAAYLNGFDANSWGEGHWNATGHRVAADVIADDLCSRDQQGQKSTDTVQARLAKTGE